MALGIAFDIAGAAFDRGFEHSVGAGSGRRIDDLAGPVEHETDAVGFAERARRLGEGRADVAGSTISVVGQRLDDDRDAAGAVTFVAHLVIIFAGLAAGAALDGTIDRVLWHIGLTRGEHSGAQARIGGRIGQPHASRGGQFADKLGEHLAALFVLRALAEHDVLELRMAGHSNSSPRYALIMPKTRSTSRCRNAAA